MSFPSLSFNFSCRKALSLCKVKWGCTIRLWWEDALTRKASWMRHATSSHTGFVFSDISCCGNQSKCLFKKNCSKTTSRLAGRLNTKTVLGHMKMSWVMHSILEYYWIVCILQVQFSRNNGIALNNKNKWLLSSRPKSCWTIGRVRCRVAAKHENTSTGIFLWFISFSRTKSDYTLRTQLLFLFGIFHSLRVFIVQRKQFGWFHRTSWFSSTTPCCASYNLFENVLNVEI